MTNATSRTDGYTPPRIESRTPLEDPLIGITSRQVW
jgi:hypothetical protein